MKTLAHITVALVLLFSVSAANAQSTPEYIYNTVEKEGKVYQKQAYKLDPVTNIHKPHFMREFTYTGNGQVKEYKTYYWDEMGRKWEHFSLGTFEYDEKANTVTHSYTLWDKKKGRYLPAKEKMVYQETEGTNGKTLFTHYIKNKANDDWSIKNQGEVNSPVADLYDR